MYLLELAAKNIKTDIKIYFIYSNTNVNIEQLSIDMKVRKETQIEPLQIKNCNA